MEDDGRNRVQTAYQVLVSDREDLLATGEGNVWDSGKVTTGQCVGIPVGGDHAGAGAQRHWRVRVWDERDSPSPYSEAARWQAGLAMADWRAQWVTGNVAREADTDWDSAASPTNPTIHLRRTFTARGPIRRATLYATARGIYEFHLNGQRVGEDYFAPGWTDYTRRLQYQTYDVTALLTDGENTLAALLGDGWFCGYVGFASERDHYGAAPSLLAQLHVEYANGTTEIVATDASWRTFSAGPIRSSDMLLGEFYDARREAAIAGWDRPAFDASSWVPVSVEARDATPLVAQPDEGVRVTELVPAKSVARRDDGTHIFDLGQNLVGWVRLRTTGKAGDRMTLRHAEVLKPDGSLYTDNLRTATQTDTYIRRGDGEETFEPRFTFHGFRYVEVSGLPADPPLDSVVGVMVQSDTARTGRFACSSPLVNQIQHNIEWGQRGNFLSVPTDCPQRDERLGWLGDAQVFVGTACHNADVAAFYAKWMRDVADGQGPEGGFPDVAPRLVDQSDGAPAWGDAGVIVPWTVYRAYGDTRIIEDHYDAMVSWMTYLHDANPNLLRRERLNNNFGDWLEPGVSSPAASNTPKDLLATAYWAYDAMLMAEMAEAVGRREDATHYAALSDDIKRAFVKEYVSDDGRIAGNTQTCYVLALHMDLLPAELRPAAARHLIEAIEAKDWHLATGFVGVSYLCPVLTRIGRLDVAYRLLENETYPSWGYQIARGATTIWERWDGIQADGSFQDPGMNSFNHYSLGSVGEWLYRAVAGIDQTPASTGYEHILIRPRPGGSLTWASGELESVRGRIATDWRIDGETFHLAVDIPANATATVHLPAKGADQVSESGAAIASSQGIEVLSVSADGIDVSVGSGNYEFTVEGRLR